MGRCEIMLWGLEEGGEVGREEVYIPYSEDTDRSMGRKHILNQQTPCIKNRPAKCIPDIQSSKSSPDIIQPPLAGSNPYPTTPLRLPVLAQRIPNLSLAFLLLPCPSPWPDPLAP